MPKGSLTRLELVPQLHFAVENDIDAVRKALRRANRHTEVEVGIRIPKLLGKHRACKDDGFTLDIAQHRRCFMDGVGAVRQDNFSTYRSVHVLGDSCAVLVGHVQTVFTEQGFVRPAECRFGATEDREETGLANLELVSVVCRSLGVVLVDGATDLEENNAHS